MTTTVDNTKLANLMAMALRLGVNQLSTELRRAGTSGGVELAVLQAVTRSARVSGDQPLRRGDDPADTAPMPPLALSYVDAGRLLDVSESTVKRLVVAGQLRAIDVGRSRRVPVSEVERYIARQLGAAFAHLGVTDNAAAASPQGPSRSPGGGGVAPATVCNCSRWNTAAR